MGLTLRHNEHAVMGTSIKAPPHLCFFCLILIIGLAKFHIWLYDDAHINLLQFPCGAAETAFCVPRQLHSLCPVAAPLFLNHAIVDFFFPPPFFCNEVLKCTRSTETETASPAKRLFIGKVEWWPVCRSNNISKLLSPAVRGVQPICASKGQVRLECCLRSRVPSLPGHHPPNSVTHTGNGSVVRVQSAFPPTYNTWHVRNVVRSILKWETHKRGVGVIFFFEALTVTLVNALGVHTALLYLLFSFPVYGDWDDIVTVIWWRSHLQINNGEFSGL